MNTAGTTGNTGGIKGHFRQFGSSKYVKGTKEFLQSNSLVAKFAFLVLVVIVFCILLSLGSALIRWLLSPSPDPILVKGMIDAKRMKVITQDPNDLGSVPILRSGSRHPASGPGSGPGVDDSGLEFTWAVWIFVDDFTYKENEYKHVFHKGNLHPSPPGGEDAGLSTPNNAPGLYITPNTNGLLVIMNTFGPVKEEVEIQDLPLNKWVNVIIRLSNQRQLDVYINGVLTERKILSDVARQNYGNVYVAANGGFDGYIDSLRYFNWAIGVNEIQNIVDNGPDLTVSKSDVLTASVPHYLSTRWFFTGLGDEYNPKRAPNLRTVSNSNTGM
tara:strand:- start:1007 stop:1993 length:987 start_codon:yes stop_codon:yes gene_type:complete